MARARRGRTPLAADPEAAFRARAARDRQRLLRLAAALRQPVPWHRAAARLEEIERLAHGLAGAGGVFGFPAVSDDAVRLERLVERWRLEPPAEISRPRLAVFARRLAALLASLADVNG